LVCKRLKIKEINTLDIKIIEIDILDKIEVENQLRNILGLDFKKIKWFDTFSIHIENATYGNCIYLFEDKLQKIRNEIILKLSRLHTLKSYKDIIITSNLLSGFHSTNYFLFIEDTIKKGIELFIKGCKFNEKNFLNKDEFRDLASELCNVLDGIDGVEFEDIGLHNIMSRNKHFIINVKDITFFGDRIFPNNSDKFRNEVLNVLDSINNLDANEAKVEFKFY